MKAFLLTLLIAPSAVFAAQPFVVLAADAAYTDAAVTPVVARYLVPTDYLGLRATTRIPALHDVVEPGHRVLMAASLGALTEDLARNQLSGSPNVVFYYQIGLETPASEQSYPRGTIDQAANLVHREPGRRFGILPGGPFFGSTPQCAFDTNATAWRSLDWSQIDYLGIQGDSLLIDACAGKSDAKDYANLTATIAGHVREKNPRIVITAQLSFRDTPPVRMLDAANQLSGMVDGFFFSYPLNPAFDRKYCARCGLAGKAASLWLPGFSDPLNDVAGAVPHFPHHPQVDGIARGQRIAGFPQNVLRGNRRGFPR